MPRKNEIESTGEEVIEEPKLTLVTENQLIIANLNEINAKLDKVLELLENLK